MQYGIWNHVDQLFVLCYIKIHWFCFALWIDLLLFMILLTSCIGHLKYIDLPSHTYLPNVETFLYRYFYNHISQYHHLLCQKILEVIRLIDADTSFLNSNFLLERWNFIIGNKWCQFFCVVFFLKWQTCFVHFSEISARCSRSNNHSFSVSYSFK